MASLNFIFHFYDYFFLISNINKLFYFFRPFSRILSLKDFYSSFSPFTVGCPAKSNNQYPYFSLENAFVMTLIQDSSFSITLVFSHFRSTFLISLFWLRSSFRGCLSLAWDQLDLFDGNFHTTFEVPASWRAFFNVVSPVGLIHGTPIQSYPALQTDNFV